MPSYELVSTGAAFSVVLVHVPQRLPVFCVHLNSVKFSFPLLHISLMLNRLFAVTCRVCCRDEQKRMSIRGRFEPFKITVRSETARKESLLRLRVIFLDDSEQTFEVEVRP